MLAHHSGCGCMKACTLLLAETLFWCRSTESTAVGLLWMFAHNVRKHGLRQDQSVNTTFAELFASVAGLKHLEFINIAGTAFTGGLLPDSPAPGQATVCDLVSSGPLKRLRIQVALGLKGELPACLLDSSSRLIALSIRAALQP